MVYGEGDDAANDHSLSLMRMHLATVEYISEATPYLPDTPPYIGVVPPYIQQRPHLPS